MDRLFYFIAAALEKLIRSLPLLVCFYLGKALGFLVYTLLPYYRHLSRQNLRIAFGETLSEKALGGLIRNNFMMLGANILCSVKIPSMPEEKIRTLFEIENPQEWDQFINRHDGQGTVVALSHFGNWELSAQIATFVKPRAAGAIYQALRNKALDDLVNRDRRTRGIATFDRKRDLSAATALLREGGLLGILIDQHAGDVGIWIPFLNKLASTSPLAATLAQRTGSLLVQAMVRTVGPARWSVRIYPPTPTEGRSVAAIMYDLGEQLGTEIKAHPTDWFWVHNRWKTPRPAFLLSRVKRGFYLPPGVSLQPFKMLVRSPNWLGDACMSARAVCALKKGRPDLHLTILTPEKLAPFWKILPEIDEIISIPPKSTPWQVSKILRSSKKPQTTSSSSCFDAALLLPNSIRSALEVTLAGVPRRIGRIKKKDFLRKRLLTQIIPPTLSLAQTHQEEEYMAIASWLGAPPLPSNSFLPKQKSSDNRDAQERPSSKRVGICPGAEYGPAKRWPIERFAEVMNQMISQNITWVLLGTPAEAPLGESLVKEFKGKVENKIGKTTLSQLIETLLELDLLLTNDTGTMHLAALLGIPTVSLFGSTEPSLTGPRGGDHRILRHPVECSPCFLRNCPIDFRCMRAITPSEVVKTIYEGLSEKIV